MDGDVKGWPDPQRPGVPLNPERDGWHWVREGGDLGPERWVASAQVWHAVFDPRRGLAPEKVAHWQYIAPCIPPMTDRPPTIRYGDVELVEMVAAALCWGGFLDPEARDDAPALYWERVSERAKAEYRAEAQLWVAAMRGREWVLMPLDLSADQVSAARTVRPALRRDEHVQDVWAAIVDARTRAWEVARRTARTRPAHPSPSDSSGEEERRNG